MIRSMIIALATTGLLMAADTAKTTTNHAEAAKEYRQRAKSNLEKAKQHEAEAQKLTSQGHNSMAAKWPAMANGPANRERSKAMQARRAAEEALRLAEYHESQSIRAQNSPSPASGEGR